MKFIYILVFKHEAQNPQSINGFFDRKEMMMHEADNLNCDLKDIIWIITP
jgi:hypothetical protein